jgi:hypothetical protein
MSDGIEDLSRKITDLCKDHPLPPQGRALVALLRAGIDQWPRLDPESRAALRGYILRDIDQLAAIIKDSEPDRA